MVILSYDSIEQNIFNRNSSNKFLDKFTEPEAEDLARKYLLPLLKKDLGSKITIFTQSYGSVFAQNVRVSLINNLLDKGHERSEIKKLLSDVVLIASGNVSSVTTPNIAGFDHGLNYTGVYFTSPTDNMAKEANPHYYETLPADHKSLTISRLDSPNNLQVTVNTHDTVVTVKNLDTEPTIEIVKDPLRHTIRVFTQRDGQSSIGGVAAIERAVINAVKRTGPVDVVDLLRNDVKEHANQKMGHAAMGNIREDIAIGMALLELDKVKQPDSTMKQSSINNIITNQETLIK